MDIDFHFGTIYVLSRWAGIDEDNSKTIATSSQFVDDNISEDPTTLSTAAKFDRGDDILKRYSGHDKWQNIDTTGSNHVWIPYHFLPSLDDDPAKKMICKKNSILANALADRLKIQTTDENIYYKLGIGLHVYADTWAHQEFSGLTSVDNIIHDIEILTPQTTTLEKLEDGTLNLAFDTIKPLGHGSAIHWPDFPYVSWKSREKFSQGRNNWEEFLEASQNIYNILQEFNGSTASEFHSFQKSILENTFQEIVFENGEQRNNAWLEHIKNDPDNYFGISNLSEKDKQISYDPNFILDDITNRKNFYNALNQHYEWVKAQLEAAQIDVLK